MLLELGSIETQLPCHPEEGEVVGAAGQRRELSAGRKRALPAGGCPAAPAGGVRGNSGMSGAHACFQIRGIGSTNRGAAISGKNDRIRSSILSIGEPSAGQKKWLAGPPANRALGSYVTHARPHRPPRGVLPLTP